MSDPHIGSSLKELIAEQCQDKAFAKAFRREQIISEIGQMAYTLRKSAGLTQTEMARRADTTQQVVARLESGRDSRVPSLDLLHKLAVSVDKQVKISFSDAD